MALIRNLHAPERGWKSLVPELVGFAAALVLAWAMGWRTGDLVWSMWLTSLVIGYSLIVWNLFGPLLRSGSLSARRVGGLLFGKLFLLAFFSVHFGGFHWGHSLFVNSIYPITPPGAEDFSPTLADYWSVVKTYGWFLPLAFLAQRKLFRAPKAQAGPAGVSAPRDSARAEHASPTGKAKDSPDMAAAYKGVVKLHLLIFFLLAADETELPEFLIYSVVYFVYFFPWREVFGKRESAPERGPEGRIRG